MSAVFSVSNIEWVYGESAEITTAPPASVKIGVQSAIAVCPECRTAWRTVKGSRPGEFKLAMRKFSMQCLHCKVQGFALLGPNAETAT